MKGRLAVRRRRIHVGVLLVFRVVYGIVQFQDGHYCASASLVFAIPFDVVLSMVAEVKNDHTRRRLQDTQPS